MSWKILVLVIVVLAAAGIGAGVWWHLRTPGDELRLPGVVEMQEVRLGSKVGGRVKEVKTAEGKVVAAGDELVVFALPELEAQRKQLKAKLDLATADWEKAKNGPRPEERRAAAAAFESANARWDRMIAGPRQEEIDQAASELEASRVDLQLAREDCARADELYAKKNVSKAEYDAARAALDRSERRFDVNRSRLALLKAGNRREDIADAAAERMRFYFNYRLLEEGTRPEEIAAARAAVDDAQGKLDELDANLAEAVVTAPNRAVVEVLGVRKGDVVPPNTPVIRVLSAEDLWVKVYVPETELGKVRLGQEVKVTIDSYPGEDLDGTIIQIASISEFTPRNVQSADERKHQVFGVKVRVPDPKGILKSGMAAQVVIPLHRFEK
jgi:multidrug resistance efflux pump